MEKINETPIVKLIKRLTSRRVPPVLYHYTSATGLIGILNSGCIWATSIRFLNDSKEYELAIALARGIVAERIKNAKGKFDLALYNVLSESLEFVIDAEVYVSSFTANGDQLSQWRGYCPPASGYSIGFAAKLLVPKSTGIPGCFLARCKYDPNDHQALIASAIDCTVQIAEANHSPSPDNRDRVFRESFKLLGRMLTLLAPVLKDSTFREEVEWRLVALASSFNATQPYFRAGRSMLVPYYEYRFGVADEAPPIAELFVGPTPHPELAKQAAETLLLKHGISKAKVRSSEIPYRTW